MTTGLDPLTAAALAARDGDPEALRRLLDGTQAPLRRFCSAMVPGQDPDDLVQETYLRAWRALGGFRGDSSVTTWLTAIARRVCLDAVARSRRRRQAEAVRSADASDRSGVSVAGPAGTSELADLIGRLDPDRREALVLTQLLGLSYEETARVTEVAVGTVRSRVARARRLLVQWLDAGAAG
jgi:RNA polymerase sigma-70 factor, ECF subfamily